MADVVVTLPKKFGMARWIAEGDAAGTPETGQEYDFYLRGHIPSVRRGERVYVVYAGRVIGYAPLVRVQQFGGGAFSLVRRGNAVAVTIPEQIVGFRGWRYRWWSRDIETPCPDWDVDY